jgi:BNR/Asp-box repeat
MMVEQRGISPMTEKPKRKKSSPRWLTAIASSVFLCIGTIVVLTLLGPAIQMAFPGDLIDSCELFIAENTGIRIQTFHGGGSRYAQGYDFTRDGGASWHRLHTYSPESGGGSRESDCSIVGSMGEQFIYLIPETSREDVLFITHDAGITWHEWTPSDIAEYPVGFQCNTIEEVSFQDAVHGGMVLGCNRYDGDAFLRRQTINLFTADGGISWALTYE